MANVEDKKGAVGGGTGAGAAGRTSIAADGRDDTGGLTTGGDQGDDRADDLGGTRSHADRGGVGANSGDMSAGRSEGSAAEPAGSSAGDPGGMGGTATNRSASTAGGGVSPIQKDSGGTDSRH
jgi:hypothetical protein